MVTHAYLQTGDQKYKQWVLEYVDAWLARIEANGGVIPDNIGPSGVVGEFRGGQWWGGFYGWNCYSGYNIMFHSIGIAAECAHLLSGDPKCAAHTHLVPHSAASQLLNVSFRRSRYLDLLRSQVQSTKLPSPSVLYIECRVIGFETSTLIRCDWCLKTAFVHPRTRQTRRVFHAAAH